MGQRIVKLLANELPHARLIAASRNKNKAGDIEFRRLELSDPGTFTAALRNIDVLIHAAGPYDHDPTELVSACLSHGVYYIDLAEDLTFISRVTEAANNQVEPRAGAITGCSTVPGLVSVLSQRFDKLETLSAVRVYLNLGSRNAVSPGLFYSLLRPIGRRLNHVICFRHLVQRIHQDGKRRRYGPYPAPFLDGVQIKNKYFPVTFHVGFDRHYLTLGLKLASFLIPKLSNSALKRLCRYVLPLANALRLLGTREGHLVVEAIDSDATVIDYLEIVAKDEGLDIPAAQAVWATKALLDQEKKTKTAPGPINLNELVTMEDALEWITRHGYAVYKRL